MDDLAPIISTVTLFTYENDELKQIDNYKIDDLRNLKYSEKSFVWIKVNETKSSKSIKEIGKIFNIHDLVIEDILSSDQRPKIEDYGDYIHITLKNIFHNKNNYIEVSQVSIILGLNVVISFHEKEEDILLDLINKIKLRGSHIKQYKSDYIAYSIIDKMVDNYFLVLEQVEEKIEELEDNLLNDKDDKQLQNIKSLKKQIIFLRKSIWPFREAIDRLEDFDSHLIERNNYIYFKDIKDHIVSIIDTIEIFRESTSEMISIHLSIVNNKMNSVMKALAVVSIIFMPLTLISGIYGMNFTYMPELNNKFAYPSVLIIMLFIAAVLILFFKKKKWI